MKYCIFLSVLLLTTASIAPAGAGENGIRACGFQVKPRCLTGQARVTLDGGAVKRVEVDVFWCGLRGRPGYTCTIDSSRGDTGAAWSDEGGATVIANTAPFNPQAPDRVKVTVGQDVSIDLGDAQSLGRCGAGAELPLTIVIPTHGKTCRVQLPAE